MSWGSLAAALNEVDSSRPPDEGTELGPDLKKRMIAIDWSRSFRFNLAEPLVEFGLRGGDFQSCRVSRLAW